MVARYLLLLVLLGCTSVRGDGGDDADEGNAVVSALLDLVLNLDLGLGGGGGGGDGGLIPSLCEGITSCYDVKTCDRSLEDAYCDQPLFVKFLTKTENNCLIDNICYTYFPLPDDPFTYNEYKSIVFCDGSFIVDTSVVTDLEIGRQRAADPYCTRTDNTIGYAGCETHVVYRCMEFGECTESSDVHVIGLSTDCLPLAIPCVQKAKEIICEAGLPDMDLVMLPQALPHKCITEQICLNNIQGNFYRAMNLPLPAVPAILA